MTKKKTYDSCKQLWENCKLNPNKCAFVAGSDEFEFLMHVFKEHPDWDIKKGCGVKMITIEKTKWGNSCFWITRQDNTKCEISAKSAIYGRTTKRASIIKACRSAIAPVIRQFRDKNVVFGETKCPFTQEVLFKENTHIDHYDLKFAEVFSKWFAFEKIDNLYSKLNDSKKDGCVDVFFVDQEIVDDFVKFHNSNTHLRAVSKTANLTILNRKSPNK